MSAQRAVVHLDTSTRAARALTKNAAAHRRAQERDSKEEHSVLLRAESWTWPSLRTLVGCCYMRELQYFAVEQKCAVRSLGG